MYETLEDLPDPLRKDLPEEAQEIYLDAFNDAWENYEEERGGDLDQEGVAHRDAMYAVKQEFVKDKEHKWHRKGTIDEDDMLDEGEEGDGFLGAFSGGITEDENETI